MNGKIELVKIGSRAQMQQATHPILKTLSAYWWRSQDCHENVWKPLPGVRLTLITEASDTAYSGMLPGHIAGFYSHEECHTLLLGPICPSPIIY